MQIAVIVWERVTNGIKGRWMALIGLVVMLYVALDIFSNRSPIHVFVSYLTFSTQSAYNRISIFHYGSQEVVRHPPFGIGLGDWERAPPAAPCPAPDLSIVVTSSRGLHEACLSSVTAGLGDRATEVFVVDNASTDGSPEMVATLYPTVRLIRNARNLGFAAANNQARRGDHRSRVARTLRRLDELSRNGVAPVFADARRGDPGLSA